MASYEAAHKSLPHTETYQLCDHFSGGQGGPRERSQEASYHEGSHGEIRKSLKLTGTSHERTWTQELQETVLYTVVRTQLRGVPILQQLYHNFTGETPATQPTHPQIYLLSSLLFSFFLP